MEFATYWLQGFVIWIKYVFRYPMTMGYLPGKRLSTSLRFRRQYRVDRGVRSDEGGTLQSGGDFAAHHIWYVEVCGLNVPYLLPLPCNQYPPPPCTTMNAVVVALDHTKLYQRHFLQYIASGILVSVSRKIS